MRLHHANEEGDLGGEQRDAQIDVDELAIVQTRGRTRAEQTIDGARGEQAQYADRAANVRDPRERASAACVDCYDC